MGLFALGSIVGVTIGILTFVALMCTWSNTGRIVKCWEEYIGWGRMERGLDLKTGKLLKPQKK